MLKSYFNIFIKISKQIFTLNNKYITILLIIYIFYLYVNSGTMIVFYPVLTSLL